MFKVPILLLNFRRPDLTAKLVEQIVRLQPETMLLAADGPRPDRPDDQVLCAETRAVLDGVNWPGRVLRRYAKENQGCGRGPAAAIGWAFEHVDRAIILEDDCMPDPSFFRYCEELLERYREDERVMHIAGSTLQAAPLDLEHSYRFSHFNVCWGWATWRRAWRHFDLAVSRWPALRQTDWLAGVIEDETLAKAWAADFDRAFERKGEVSFWDYQWAFACWANRGLAVLPRVNLISNAGCGPEATHTHDSSDPLSSLPVQPLPFPLRHPPMVLRDEFRDRRFLHDVLLARSRPRRMPAWTRLRRAIGRTARRLRRAA